ncbi:MAG: peptidoglycan editing factor PgeF [Thiomicrorhabdus sp.]|nr:peptidoglycan editing factor PgeF [Thiomicrorhabdus sp.]
MFISPNWPVPNNIKAFCTTRKGGESKRPFDSFNLATHVEDDLLTVLKNRALLFEAAHLPAEPIWLNQQHTNKVLAPDASSTFFEPEIADASWTQAPNTVLAVMTADCLPILLTDEAGTCVAAIHAGWKGLANNVVSETLQAMPVQNNKLMAWIGPAISQKHFEVGQDVFDAFVTNSPENASFFVVKETESNKYFADLPGLVTAQLNALGVEKVYKSDLCSFEDEEHFYSYRRDGKTGRMASLIWIEKPTE